MEELNIVKASVGLLCVSFSCSCNMIFTSYAQLTHRNSEDWSIFLVAPLHHFHRTLSEFNNSSDHWQARDWTLGHSGRSRAAALGPRAQDEESIKKGEHRETCESNEHAVRATGDATDADGRSLRCW